MVGRGLVVRTFERPVNGFNLLFLQLFLFDFGLHVWYHVHIIQLVEKPMFNKIILAAVLAMSAAPSIAVERILIEGVGRVVHERIEVFTLATDNMDLFAVKASERLLAYSEATGYEACGMIAKGQGSFGLVITSNHSHIACAIQPRELPDGMVSTGVDIHSHGLGAVKMNQSDMLFSGIRANARSRHMHGAVYGQDRNMFSPADLALGEGYLAGPAGTLYHDGKGGIGMVKVAAGH